jgi:hypothetical protein
MSLVYCWYTRYGHHPDEVTARRAAAPWYTTKTEPSFPDILAKLRRTIIVARFLPECPAQPTLEQITACTEPGPQQPRSAKVGVPEVPIVSSRSRHRLPGQPGVHRLAWSTCGLGDPGDGAAARMRQGRALWQERAYGTFLPD